MEKTSFKRVKKAVISPSINSSKFEKSVLKERLRRAVEKLKEAREEIRKSVKAIMTIQDHCDDLAEQVISAATEASTSERASVPWIIRSTTKASMKREAAKPLLLLRSD